ncbi:MAG TPA: hypothetical protein PKE52_09155, partial [Bacteroidales bacterium]|nr:hypothetical protein [Bacteroidales bacterium]
MCNDLGNPSSVWNWWYDIPSTAHSGTWTVADMFGAFLYLNQNGGIPRGYLTNVSNIRSLIVGDIVQAD